MRKIKTKPIETIGIELEDEVVKECKFSALAMAYLDEEFEGFTAIFKDAQNRPFKNGSKLLYCGLKVCNPDVTMEEARALISNMSIDNIIDLFEFVADTIEVDKEKKKRTPQDHKKKKN